MNRFIFLKNSMKIRHLLASFTLVCSCANACGLHPNTGFTQVSEPGSLAVSSKVIEYRQKNAFGNVDKLRNLDFAAFQIALTKANPNKLNFTIFEAVQHHYSDVTLSNSIFTPVAISARQSILNKGDLLLISEKDVLDALARGVLSWHQAKARGLIRVNGPQLEAAKLELWFAQRFIKV